MDHPQPELGITIDCADAPAMARFWCHALGYAEAPPPQGWSDWPSSGTGPLISFLGVPEPKTAKNRVHLDVRVSGGRDVDPSLREKRIHGMEADLVARDARRRREDRVDGRLDHLVMEDPEGNEFCIV